MLKKVIFSLLVSFLIVPTAFAGTSETAVTSAESGGGDSSMCYDCYGSGISFNVSSVVTVKADKIILYGSYTVYEMDSKKEVVQELASAFADLKSATSKYGVLTRSSLYTYSDWQYTNLYDGSLSVQLELTDHTALTTVENLFYDHGFDNWTEVRIASSGAAAKLAIPELKELISEQKDVYEKLLDYSLGSISGLYVYTSVDSSTFDADTDMVDVTVWADVSYRGQ